MFTSRKHLRTAATIIIIIIAAAFLLRPHHYLTLRNRDTKELYARYSMKEGDRFSIEFKHSVNLSPVTDIYEIQDGNIYVEETIYYHFGAGVQSELNERETLTYGEDGSMIVGNIHQERNNVGYIVATIYDHYLSVNGQTISLGDLCGKNAAVRFNYEWQLF